MEDYANTPSSAADRGVGKASLERTELGAAPSGSDGARDSGSIRNSCAGDAGLLRVSTSLLDANSFNPNMASRQQLDAMCSELRRDGINHRPIVVRPSGARFEIITGEKTWRAAIEISLDVVEIRVVRADDYEARRLCWIDNLGGKPCPLKLGRMGRQMLDAAPGKTQLDLAQELGLKEPTLRNRLKLAAYAARNPHIPDEVLAKTPIREVCAALDSPKDIGADAGEMTERKTIAIKFVADTPLGKMYKVTVLNELAEVADAKEELHDLARRLKQYAGLYGTNAVIQEIADFARFIVPPKSTDKMKSTAMGGLGAWLALKWAQRMGRDVRCDAAVQEELRWKWAKILPVAGDDPLAS